MFSRRTISAIALLVIAGSFGARADELSALADTLAGTDALAAKQARQQMEAIVHRAAAPGADAEKSAVAASLVLLLDDKRPDSIRREALNWLGLVGGTEQVTAIAALLRGAAGIADDARMALERIPGAAAEDALLEALPTAAPSAKAGILSALAHRNVMRAADAIVREARSANDKATAWAAFHAATSMGIAPNAIAPPPLGGTQEERIAYARGWAQAANALLARGDTAGAERMYLSMAAGGGDNALSCAALTGLLATKSQKTVDLALGYLSEPAVRPTAVSVLKVIPGEAASERLARAYPVLDTPVRATIVEVLAARRPASLPALLADAAKDPAPEVRVAAARANGESPLEDDLLAVVQNGSPWARNAAADSLLDRAEAQRAAGHREPARATFEKMAQAPVHEAALIRAWNGIEDIGNADSLPVVDKARQTYAKATPPSISREFTTALTRAYISVTAAQPAKEQAIATLEAMASTAEPAIHSLIQEKLRALGYDTQRTPQQRGFLTAWKIAGPIPDPENKAYGTSYFDETQPIPESGIAIGDRHFPWADVIADNDPAVVDLGALYSGKQNAVAYGVSQVRVQEATPVVLLVGSNDGCALYLNGKRIHGIDGQRGLTVDNDRIETSLGAGMNTILMKSIQQGGGWQFCVRITKPDGTPLDVSACRP